MRPRQGELRAPGPTGRRVNTGGDCLARVDVDPLESTHFVRLDLPAEVSKEGGRLVATLVNSISGDHKARDGQRGDVKDASCRQRWGSVCCHCTRGLSVCLSVCLSCLSVCLVCLSDGQGQLAFCFLLSRSELQ